MKNYNVVELFSGIGSQARALERLGFKITVQATCEWDVHAFTAYDAIHSKGNVASDKITEINHWSRKELIKKLSEYNLSFDGKRPSSKNTLEYYDTKILRVIMGSIIRNNNLIDISSVKGEMMPDNTDILTYSFPCQDLSNVGAFHGYNKGIDRNSGSRSSLIWQVGRVLFEMKDCGKRLPKYLIMENVPTLLSGRHKPNFELWIKELDDLGYISKYVPVNAKNYGLPQNRPRLLMISVYAGGDIKLKEKLKNYFCAWGDNEDKILYDYKNSIYYKELYLNELLRIPLDPSSKFWMEALECTPNNTPSRKKIWDANPKIVNEEGVLTDDKFIRTITTKQDRHPNSGNIWFHSGIPGRANFRYLTPRECLLFMGFTDDDYDKMNNLNNLCGDNKKILPRDKIIRLAGNSIPIQMLEGFFYQLYNIEKIVSAM